ncbi:type II secretion system protein GspD [Aliivibrio fischeri]
MRKFLYGSLALLMLSGCASQEFKDNLAFNDAVHQSIGEQSNPKLYKKVNFITKPPMVVTPIVENVDMEWLKKPSNVNAIELPLSVVLEKLMSDVNIPIYFSKDVQPSTPITLNFSSSRQDVLNSLSKESGYGIEYKNNRLEISKYITRVFTLNMPSGTMSGQLGSQGQSSSEDSARIEGQYLNVEYKDVQIVDEIAASLEKVLGGDDIAKKSISVSPALSSVTVTATIDQMQDIEYVIDHYKKELSKQVILDIQMIEFRSNLGTEHSIDWNIVKDTGNGLLQFFVPGTTTISQGAGYGLAFTGKGKWTGTESFIRVLEQQGSVSTQTPITAMILNNQPAKITQQNVIPYIYEASSDSSEGVISASVTRKTEVEGVDMMVNSIIQDEYVSLRISGQLQKIFNRETEKVGDVNLGMLSTQKSEITFANKLRYGQTFVIASVKQTSKTAEQTKSFWMELFGGTGTRNDTVETLVLLTPRKGY